MKKYKKFIIPTLILVGGLVFIFKDKLFKKKSSSDYNDGNDGGGSGGGGGSTRNDNFPLKKGSKGSNVRDLQQAILGCDKSMLPKFGADGDFGSETEGAVLKLLGKKSVANNSEIQSIRNKCGGGGTTPTPTPTPTPTNPNAERIRLANDLKNKWQANKSLSFMATQTTQIGLYFYDKTNKASKKSGTEKIDAGTRIEKGSNVTSISIDSGGYMSLYLKSSRSTFSVINLITVSPYAVKYV